MPIRKPEWLKTEHFLVVIFKDKAPKNFSFKTELASEIHAALREENYKKAYGLAYPEETISVKSHKKISMDSTGLMKDSHGAKIDPIIKIYLDTKTKVPQLVYKSLVALSNNIQKARTLFVRDQLARFLKANLMPITPDGCFIAYKYVVKIKGGLVDAYTKSIPNNVGDTPHLEDYECDWDPHKTCSEGLHVASWGYVENKVKSSDVSIIACKVNPSDVVSVPYEYGDQKMRCRKYTVVARDFKSPHDSGEIHTGWAWDTTKYKKTKEERAAIIVAPKEVTTVKRGRGRPRKEEVTLIAAEPKRGRGRPSKKDSKVVELIVTKRGRGRPPKKIAPVKVPSPTGLPEVNTGYDVKVPFLLSTLSKQSIDNLVYYMTSTVLTTPSKSASIKIACDALSLRGVRVIPKPTHTSHWEGPVAYLPLNLIPLAEIKNHRLDLLSCSQVGAYVHRLLGVYVVSNPANKKYYLREVEGILKKAGVKKYTLVSTKGYPSPANRPGGRL